MFRDTYADTTNFVHRIKAAATLLGISENTLRAHEAEGQIEIMRQTKVNPAAPATRLYTIEKIFEIANWRRATGKVKKIGKRPIFIVTNIFKGGVGKSTTTAETGTQFQLLGNKVLMIDLDPSSNLSLLMGYESDLEESEAGSYGLTPKAIVKYTFDHLITPFLDYRKNREHVWVDSNDIIKKPYGEFGPHLIPADLYLGDLAEKLSAFPGDRDHAMKAFFKLSAEGKIPGFDINAYDYVFIDCAASLNIMTLNAMATADYVICPVKMDLFGAKGISRLNIEINELRSRSSDFDIELVILPTHYSNNISRTARMQEQLQAYRNNLSTCSISQSELFPSTQDSYMSLTLQMPTSEPVKDYRKFVDILVGKISKKFS